ncbi:MAG TPA: SMC-Scp complex subunit ScpB [Methanothrix sp.]|nr:SMC-Scp complex subunit ScpB [Methanothrix sp.]HPT19428.1 SMC-Scp complex subunit ScpB [Methanothrix sp.]
MILTADSQAKAVIEAALFASGKTLSLRELAGLSGLSEERARAMAEDLAAEYAARGSGIEIKGIGEGYSMQVAFGLAGRVISCAPKEIEAPLIRTLAIIAYKQPIKQSELVEIRGNKGYEHVKELETRGLISAEKAGHTKLLTTTRGFADYFGIVSSDPQAIRKALLQDRMLVGVSPMYESLAMRLGLDYIVVNPYRPAEEDLARLQEIDLLILAPGYAERVKGSYSGRMLEAGVRTLSQLKVSAEVICRVAGSGDVEPLAAEIDSLLKRFRQRAGSARPIRPLTPMIGELARDLHLPVSEDGLSVAPDSSGMEAEIQVPVHQPYDMDILERIVQRCEKILSGGKV